MTRSLKTLGLALVAALALSGVIASAASASSALFTASVGANEQVETHGEQIGNDTFTIAGAPPMTCGTITETGFPEEGGTHKLGPSAPNSTITPAYDTCHIKFGALTRTLTITLNGCTYTTTATKNTAGFSFGVDVAVVCPGSQKIEIHVYNTASHSDSGVATLCTYELPPQEINNQIELTNNSSGGGPDDVEGHMSATLSLHNKILSGTCGNNTNTTATYEGTHTLRATNENDEFVSTTIS